MTGSEFSEALARLRWSATAVAEWCGYSRQAATRWTNGTAAVPEAVAEWLARRMSGRLDEPPARG